MNISAIPDIPREELWFIACHLAVEVDAERVENVTTPP
jgi:hypothetical protein